MYVYISLSLHMHVHTYICTYMYMRNLLSNALIGRLRRGIEGSSSCSAVGSSWILRTPPNIPSLLALLHHTPPRMYPFLVMALLYHWSRSRARTVTGLGSIAFCRHRQSRAHSSLLTLGVGPNSDTLESFNWPPGIQPPETSGYLNVQPNKTRETQHFSPLANTKTSCNLHLKC